MSATTSDDILGGGLDIEGWSYHKAEVAAKIAGYIVSSLSGVHQNVLSFL